MDVSERCDFRTADIWRRPQTEELVDVHVYLVPSEEWIETRKLAKRNVIDHAVSSGFVRVLPSITLYDLRNDICEQLGTENVPETFVFLRSVGRNFTQVKPKQELDLKVKSFIPPYAEEPEVYVKEGSFTLLRSASVGPEVLSSREHSSSVQNSSVSVTSSGDFPTSSESARPHPAGGDQTGGAGDDEEVRRTQSLDRQTPKMTSRRAPVLHPRPPQVQRRPFLSRNPRPPTPRVKEMPLSEVILHPRSKSIASVKTEEVIRESPIEIQLEEIDTVSQNLAVDEEEARIDIHSPPPRPSSSKNYLVEDITIPVPTPTPTPVNRGKESLENFRDSPKHENDVSAQTGDLQKDSSTVEPTDGTDSPSHDEPRESHEVSAASNEEGSSSDADEGDGGTEDRTAEEEHKTESSDTLRGELNQVESRISFDNIHSNEDVIVDPIKLLEGEGESRKNLDESDGRDHYDEGFHSGELVNSEEDSNSIETLASFGAKDEVEAERPTIRAATPMPRSNSFYKSGKNDGEIRSLQTMSEDLKAERRLRELKRDALLHKVKELQRRKTSSKDQAREEWRKRYMDVKRSTPRLEDHCSKLRQELEKLVKDMLVSVKTDPDSKPHRPSKKTSYKIMIMRLLQEVEDLRRRLQSVTVKLNAETKLRSQAEFEVKKLRQDLLHKKTQVTLTRKQASFPQTTEMFFISAV